MTKIQVKFSKSSTFFLVEFNSTPLINVLTFLIQTYTIASVFGQKIGVYFRKIQLI